jgi:hypothetical protein
MFTTFKNLATVSSFAFKNLTGIMQSVGKRVGARIAPWYHLTIHPDETITIIERN